MGRQVHKCVQLFKKMRLQNYLTEEKSKLYHTTFKRNLPNIKRMGITPQKTPTMRGAMGQDVRDDPNAIYAFNDKIEAFKWAFKMNWEMDKQKEVVVIEFKNTNDDWQKDTHWQAQLGHGSWIRSRQSVPPENITKIFSQKTAFDTIKRMNMAGELN